MFSCIILLIVLLYFTYCSHFFSHRSPIFYKFFSGLLLLVLLSFACNHYPILINLCFTVFLPFFIIFLCIFYWLFFYLLVVLLQFILLILLISYLLLIVLLYFTHWSLAFYSFFSCLLVTLLLLSFTYSSPMFTHCSAVFYFLLSSCLLLYSLFFCLFLDSAIRLSERKSDFSYISTANLSGPGCCSWCIPSMEIKGRK